MENGANLYTEAKALNAGIISLPRLLILHELSNYYPDGALFRDLRPLQLTDGNLLYNLRALEKIHYIRHQVAKVEHKKLDAYFITQEGLDAFSKVKEWLGKISKKGGNNNGQFGQGDCMLQGAKPASKSR
jgi:Winged helix DNA-binding domain